jgi:hypothetical protein
MQMNENHNGHIKCEQYGGALLVYVPQLKWYQLGVPYTSELERILSAAANHEEKAVLVVPDKTTSFFLKLESFPKHIPIVLGEKEAKQTIDLNKLP